MMWGKGLVEWFEGDTAYVSVPFSWLLTEAYQRCAWLKALGYRVRVGGPAVSFQPDFQGRHIVAEVGGHVNALCRHNPEATFTSRGCPNKCAFCAVPKVEGDLVELRDWEPKPIVCDNNLLACSRRHFDRVIDRLKPVPDVDFNQGLDARLLTVYHADRLAELRMKIVRLAWDKVDEETRVMEAISLLSAAGFGKRRIGVYVLIGFDDTPEDALYRCEMLRARGVRANVMRYQPLGCEQKNNYIAPGWTERQLRDYCRYWNRQNWLSKVPFEEYRGCCHA